MTATHAGCFSSACHLCHPLPVTGCEVCGNPADVVSLYTGKRCADHAPTFDPATAVAISMAGWPRTAASYVRSWREAA